MSLSVMKGKDICPMCGHEAHKIDRLWECPAIQRYSCWGEDGGWEIEKFDENEIEVEWED